MKQSDCSWIQQRMRRIAHDLGWYRSFKRLAHYLGFYGTFDSEAALRSKNRRILELENVLAERPIIYIHTGPLPAIVAPPLQTTGPLPQTTGPLPQVTGPLPALGIRNRARQRAFLQQLNSQPSGAMARIHKQMERQKQTTSQLGSETERLPAVPSSITRPLRAMIYEESESEERTNAS